MTPRVKLHLGDCLDVLRTLRSGSVDAIVTDPPYGLTNCHWDIEPDWAAWWIEAKRVAKPDAFIVMFHQMPAAMVPIMAARKLYKYDLVWSKNLSTGFLDVNRRPLRSHEMVLVFSQGRPKYNRTDWPREAWNRAEGRSLRAKGTGTPLYSKANRECRTYTYGPTICAKSVLPFKRPGNFNARADGLSHTTKKPVPMMEWLVKSYSPEGGIVLDSWMGSGSTGVGCLNTGRAFIGIDAARLKHARRAARSAVPA